MISLVQNMFAAFGRGDIGYIVSNVAPDCRWVAPKGDLPYSGEYHGPAGAAEFFRKPDATEEFTAFEPLSYFENSEGDVVALGREESVSKLTGKKASSTWAMLFKIRDGKVTYWEPYVDTAAYVRAHAA